jgi:glycosyltransferase involved in cell wall biosynthesis
LAGVELVDSNEGCSIPQPIFGTVAITIPVRSANAFRYLDIRFATYLKVVLGKLTVVITTPGIKPVKQDVDISSIADNSFVRFDLGTHIVNGKLSISLEAQYKGSSHIAVWYGGKLPSYRLYKDEGFVPVFAKKPIISILTGVYNVAPRYFSKTIQSVLNQTYGNWEWIIVDDKSTDKDLVVLLTDLARKHPNIKVISHDTNSGISESQNSALNKATGEWFLVLDHDDTLSEGALAEVANRINADESLELIYSDEDKLSEDGSISSPFFKPDWSPALMLCQNYICHLCAYKRTEALRRVPEGFEKDFDGSQDYRYLLKFSAEPVCAAHIPIPLYHWRIHDNSTAKNAAVKPYAAVAARKAITESLKGKAKVLSTEYVGVYRPFFKLDHFPCVTVIIPTKGNAGLIDNLLESLYKTDYDFMDIILVDNGSDMAILGPVYDKYKNLFYEEFGSRVTNLQVVYGNYPFNFSYQVNQGVALAKSKYVLLLNNDIEIINPGWLKEMVALMELYPDVGAVGARLLYPNGTLQHGGVLVGAGGVAGHCHKHLRNGDGGYFNRVMTIHEVSAVTGACLLTRTDVYNNVGGFDETMPKAFNDVDFCLKVRKEGHRILYQPWACLYHHESVSRGVDAHDDPVFIKAIETMKTRWAPEIENDPYFNPHFSRASESYVIAY